jgi:hypothetical protein
MAPPRKPAPRKRRGPCKNRIHQIRRGEAWRDYSNNPFAGLLPA